MVERLFAEAPPGPEPGINGRGTLRPAPGDSSLLAGSAVLDPVPFLIAAGERLDASLDFDQTIGVILDIIVPALADQAAIHLLLDDGRFRRVATRHRNAKLEAISEALGDEYLDSGQIDGPIHRMLADGRSLIGSPLTDDDVAVIVGTKRRVKLIRKLGLTSAMVVPLAARGRRTGVLTMSTIVRPRFEQAHRHLAEEIGRRAGLALDTSRLYCSVSAAQRESERARQRMEFLAEASAALSASLDIHTTLQTVAELATREFAESCNLALVEDDGTVRRVAVAHADPALKSVFDAHSDVIPIEPGSTHPIVGVLATGQPYVNNVATEVTRRAYGEGPYRELMDRVSFTAGIVVPLEARGRRIGVMNLGTSVPGQIFDEDDVALCMQLASRAALAIDNARLYGAAQQSQVASERARKRMSFLAEASTALSASLDVRETLQTIVRLAVPEMAESCSVVLVEPDGQLRRVAVAHADPEHQKLLDESSPVLPPSARWSYPLATALADGGPIVEHDVASGSGVAVPAAPDPAMLLELRVGARLIVPLEAQGRKVGILAFASSDPARTFDASDVTLGMELAARAVLALENAKLYQDARTANDRLAEQLELSDAVVKNIAEAIVVSDRSWKVTYVNPMAELLLGQTSADLVGRDSHEVAHVSDLTGGPPPGHDCHIREAIRAGMTIRLDGVRLFRADGRSFPADVSAAPLMKDGQMVGAVTIFRDVSDRQAEAAELRQLHQRLQQRLEAVLGLHEVGKLLTSASDLDAAGRRILEIAIRAARLNEATLRRRTSGGKTRIWQRVGRTHGATATCETRALARARSHTLASGQPSVVQVTCRRPDAGTHPRTVWCVPLVAKGGVIGVLESVGGRQPAEEPTLEILGSIALQAATALENARLYREVADSERALRHLVQQLMAAHEDERRRLAYEIHDGFAQLAAGVQQLVEAYAHDFPSDSHAGRQRMDIAIGLARQTVSEIRRVLAGLRPTVLDDFGLARGLRAYAEGLAAERLSVRFSEAIGTQRLPSSIEIALFRLAQEALTNVRKHAGVDRAELRLARRHAAIVLEVEDRGRGFDLAAVAHSERPGQRLGLLSMHERIGHVNGTLEILSQCGKGTLVRAIVPIVGSRAHTIAHGGADEQTTDAHDRR